MEVAATVVGTVGSTVAAEVDTAAWIATEEDTACWDAPGIPALDLAGTSLVVAPVVEAIVAVALADCS